MMAGLLWRGSLQVAMLFQAELRISAPKRASSFKCSTVEVSGGEWLPTDNIRLHQSNPQQEGKQSIPQEPSDLQQQGLPHKTVPVFKAGVPRWGAAFGAPQKVKHIVPTTCLLLTLPLKLFLARHSVSLSTCMAMLASSADACPVCGLAICIRATPAWC